MDECVGRMVNAILEKGGAAIITADHGNAEKLMEYHRGVNVSAVFGSIKRTEYINVVIGAVKLFLCKLAWV